MCLRDKAVVILTSVFWNATSSFSHFCRIVQYGQMVLQLDVVNSLSHKLIKPEDVDLSTSSLPKSITP